MLNLEQLPDYVGWTKTMSSCGQLTSEQLHGAASAGIEVVINLTPTHADDALNIEPAVIAALALDYLPIPVNFQHPTRSEFAALALALKQRTEQRCLVHSSGNKAASVLVAAYLVAFEAWPAQRAWETINRVWRPNGVWSAFFQQARRSDAKLIRRHQVSA